MNDITTDDKDNGDCETPSVDTVSGFSSTASTPVPRGLFEPRYHVALSNSTTKDGDIVKYIIMSTDTENRTFTVCRQYEDFEWLEHCLTTSRNINGLIVPPLPCRPAVTSQMAEAKSRKQLGSDSRAMTADNFQRDCQALEVYLNQMLSHDHFGSDSQLDDFLTKPQAPARTKVKKGILSKLSDAIENRKVMHKDCDDFFQRERDWANTYGGYMTEASENFDKAISSQFRLCNALSHLATALNLCLVSNEEIHVTINKLLCKFASALEKVRLALEIETLNDENTLGFHLDLYAKYIEAEKEMLYRRTCLMVEYENANKMMDKAKTNKRDMAEKSKLDAEKSFEECSDVATQEIKKFHRQRIQVTKEALALYAEAQVKTARDTYALLENSLSVLRNFRLPDCPLSEE